MDTQPRRYEWRSIVLLIYSLASAFVILGASAGLLVAFLLNRRTLGVPPPLPSILGATTLTAIGLLLLPAGVLSWQRLNGRKFEPFQLPRLSAWEWVAFPLLWIVMLVLATLLYDAPGGAWYLPFVHFLAVMIPVYLLVRVAIHTIPLGSIQRVWAVFGSGYSLSLLLAIILEGLMVVLGIVVLAVLIGYNPERLAEMQRLVARIEAARNVEALVYILEPLLRSPLTLLVALGFLSVFVPIVEELAKSIGVWLVADRLRSPAQGFALGLLSGAGFALAEGLTATLTPDSTWALSFLTRGVSSCMHMLSTGLVGMGIASLRLERNLFKMAFLTCLAILLHATWNAGAVLMVAGVLRIALEFPQVSLTGMFMGIAGIALLFALGSGMLVSLVLLNLRPGKTSFSAEPGLQSRSADQLEYQHDDSASGSRLE